MEDFLLKNPKEVEAVTKEVKRDEKLYAAMQKLGNHALVLSQCVVREIAGFPPLLDISEIEGDKELFKKQLLDLVLKENLSTLLDTHYHILMLDQEDHVQLAFEEIPEQGDRYNTRPSLDDVDRFLNQDEEQMRGYFNSLADNIEKTYGVKVASIGTNIMSIDLNALDEDKKFNVGNYIDQARIIFEEVYPDYVFGDVILEGKLIFHIKVNPQNKEPS